MKTIDSKTHSTAIQHKSTAAPFFQPEESREAFFGSTEQPAPFFNPAPPPAGNSPAPTTIQAKLTVGAPDDVYEQEADAMADKVVQRLAIGSNLSIQRKCTECAKDNAEEGIAPKLQKKSIFESNEEPANGQVQRKCKACTAETVQPKRIQRAGEEEEPEVQEKFIQPMRIQRAAEEEETELQQKPLHLKRIQRATEEEEPALQAKGDAPGLQASSDLESRLNTTKGSGSPLPDDTRSSMESSFGTDFSNVRVHTNNSAVQMNQELGAQAFTHGSDIYFNSGKYDTGSSGGQHLLAHELTHTVQQGGAVRTKRIMREELEGKEKDISAGTAATDLLPPTTDATENSAIFRKEINTFQALNSSNGLGRASGQLMTGNSTPNVQKADVLENDLKDAPAMNCDISTEKLTDPGASLEITFNRAGTKLTAEDITNIAVFVNNWQGADIKVPVYIHGYASKEGPPSFNWPLSCRRAEAVAEQMQQVQPAVVLSTTDTFPAGTPGIPAGFIRKYAHGETEDFSKTSLLPNRRAMVHVPTLPTLPKKLAKSPLANLKSGPTYTLNSRTNTPTSKAADFSMFAEFEDDPANGVLGACGQVRQYLRWSNNNVDPGRIKNVEHEGFLADKTYLPGVWYEDRDQVNTRYGHRSGPHSAPNDAFDQYFDKAGKSSPNTATGRFYAGNDSPGLTNDAAFVASFVGNWEFRLDAIDTCNGNKVLGSDYITIKW